MNLHIDDSAGAIKDAFFASGFVRLTSDRPVSQQSLLQLARAFGELLSIERHTSDDPALQVVSHNGLFGQGEVPWHSDYSYGRGSFYGTLLYNAVNGTEASTYFADMQEVCSALPEGETNRLTGLIGHYSAHKHLRSTFFSCEEGAIMKERTIKRPLVFPHPATGRNVLYISPATFRHVSNGEVDLASLVELVDEHSWEHVWQDYDVLLYDNLRLMHRRPAFKGRRTLWRIQFDPNYGRSKLAESAEQRH